MIYSVELGPDMYPLEAGLRAEIRRCPRKDDRRTRAVCIGCDYCFYQKITAHAIYESICKDKCNRLSLYVYRPYVVLVIPATNIHFVAGQIDRQDWPRIEDRLDPPETGG